MLTETNVNYLKKLFEPYFIRFTIPDSVLRTDGPSRRGLNCYVTDPDSQRTSPSPKQRSLENQVTCLVRNAIIKSNDEIDYGDGGIISNYYSHKELQSVCDVAIANGWTLQQIKDILSKNRIKPKIKVNFSIITKQLSLIIDDKDVVYIDDELTPIESAIYIFYLRYADGITQEELQSEHYKIELFRIYLYTSFHKGGENAEKKEIIESLVSDNKHLSSYCNKINEKIIKLLEAQNIYKENIYDYLISYDSKRKVRKLNVSDNLLALPSRDLIFSDPFYKLD